MSARARITPKWGAVVKLDAVPCQTCGHSRRLVLDAARLFNAFLNRLGGQAVNVIVEKAGRQKSKSQTGYLWGVLYPVIADDLGYTRYEHDALHDALMRKLRGLRPEPNPLGLRVSLAAMSHEEVSDYIEDVRHFAVTELGIVTPDSTKVVVPAGKTRVA